MPEAEEPPVGLKDTGTGDDRGRDARDPGRRPLRGDAFRHRSQGTATVIGAINAITPSTEIPF